MTPKEKARELFDKYYDEMFHLRDGYNSSEVYQATKQCVLILVDEIVMALPSKPKEIETLSGYINILIPDFEFWQEVKSEIQAL